MKNLDQFDAAEGRLDMFSVSTIEELALLLKVGPAELREFSQSAPVYRTRVMPKRHGGRRRLDVPEQKLEVLQAWIKRQILDKVQLPPCVHGGVLGRSPKTNAAPHVGKHVVACLDLQDFFPSVSPKIVRTIFGTLGFRDEALEFLVSATMFRGSLPQGTHTSPCLANLAAVGLDLRLLGLARQHSLSYTRFVDDLTFSGGRRLTNLLPLIGKIIAQEGFQENVGKRRVMRSHERQTVTGVLVNKKTNITKDARRRLRKQLLAEMEAGSPAETTLGKLAWAEFLNPETWRGWRREIGGPR